MDFIKQKVNHLHETAFHGTLMSIKPDRRDLRESHYDSPVLVGMGVAHEGKIYEIIDVSLSTPNITGGRTMYVKVKLIENQHNDNLEKL